MNALQPQRENSQERQKLRIVLADDHKLLCDALVGYLEAGPEMEIVGLAHNGRDCLRLVQELSPDIVVLDYSMPDLTGLEVARTLLDAGNRAKILLLTMHSDSEKVSTALEAGVRGYVLKNAAAQDLVRAIRVVSEGKVYLSETLVTDVVTDYLELRAAQNDEDPLSVLSDRETEVLRMQAEGMSIRDIAERLHLSPKTVETYKYRIKSKLNISDNAGLIKLAIRSNLVGLD